MSSVATLKLLSRLAWDPSAQVLGTEAACWCLSLWVYPGFDPGYQLVTTCPSQAFNQAIETKFGKFGSSFSKRRPRCSSLASPGEANGWRRKQFFFCVCSQRSAVSPRTEELAITLSAAFTQTPETKCLPKYSLMRNQCPVRPPLSRLCRAAISGHELRT